MNRILLSAPDVGEIEEKYLLEAFRSGWIAPAGPDLEHFESELAQLVGVEHGLALSSGTAALHLALLARKVGPGDVVLTSSMTFAATANAISYTGAQPYFVDSDAGTGNMDTALLQQTLERIYRAGSTVAAIMPVDLLGKAANYTEICRLAAEYGIPVIADAAESLGSSHSGVRAGAWGDAAAISFNGNKVMTTSGGGMLMTNDASLARRARYLATQARQPVSHYEHLDVGYNYRLSNLLAALGRGQLTRLESLIAKRRAVRDFYRALFDGVEGVRLFGGENDSDDNCWLTAVVIDEREAGWSSSHLASSLASADIESRPLWKPMHLQPAFRAAPATINGVSQRLFEQGLTLPSGSALTKEQLESIAEAITKFLGGAR